MQFNWCVRRWSPNDFTSIHRFMIQFLVTLFHTIFNPCIKSRRPHMCTAYMQCNAFTCAVCCPTLSLIHCLLLFIDYEICWFDTPISVPLAQTHRFIKFQEDRASKSAFRYMAIDKLLSELLRFNGIQPPLLTTSPQLALDQNQRQRTIQP